MNGVLRASRLRGMSLPELMVGLAVGLFVVTIAISTFVSTRTLNVVNSSSTRMTENARLVTETLHTDLRNSGFVGCLPLNQRLNQHVNPEFPILLSSALNNDARFIANNGDYSGVRGYSGSPSGHSPALPTALASALTGREPNSDIVSVRVPADSVAMSLKEAMASTSGDPKLEADALGNTIVKGDVLLISDCVAAAMFQVTASNPALTGILSHATGALTPGNATTDLKRKFGSNATVYRMQTRHYYVAPSILRPGTNSLWRLSVPAPDGGEPAPEEVASGIDRLVVTYGVDNGAAPDFNINKYVTASAVTKWDRVLSARMEIVAATAEDRMAMSKQTYKLSGANQLATDNRLRTVLTEVVTLRNGTP